MINNPLAYRISIIVCGFLCLVFVVVALLQSRAQKAADDQSAENRSTTTQIQQRLSAPVDTTLLKLSAAPATRQEETAYLTFIRTSAVASKVQIARLTITTIGGDLSALLAKSPEEKKLVEGITPISTTVEALGNYTSLLRFTNKLLAAPRLYNLANLAWSRGKTPDDTRLSLFITRYVEAPSAASGAQQVEKV